MSGASASVTEVGITVQPLLYLTLFPGMEKSFGCCQDPVDVQMDRPDNFDPFRTCYENANCQTVDINLVCNTNLAEHYKCECRTDMRWNSG